MFFQRENIVKTLKAQIKTKRHILGVASGAGISAKYAVRGGADLILVLNAGRFRQMGLSSLACLMPYANCNEMVMQFGAREIIPVVQEVPVIFGLCATDPTIDLNEYIERIRRNGFAGINNFPSVGLLDGVFREALEEAGLSYRREVEAVQIANAKGIFSIAFVFDENQAEEMVRAGADVICAQMGFTKGGELGAKKVLSLESSICRANAIFDVVDKLSSDRIKVIYGGPVSTPLDLAYIYDNTKAMGYFGGSAFERIPMEAAITKITREFKQIGAAESDPLLAKMLDGVKKHYQYADFVKDYIASHYMDEIALEDLAVVSHISRTYLSSLFKKEVGCTFSEYLTRYRIHRAMEIIQKPQPLPLAEIAELVGYGDYAHFSKMFKRQTGLSPSEYKKSYKNT